MEPHAEHITVRSLTIVDEKGEARIWLDGGGADIGSQICMWSKAGKSLQIWEQPSGYVTITLDGPGNYGGQVSLTGNGLCVRDDEGKYCVTIGKFNPKDDFRGITVYKDGRTHTQIPLS